MDNTIIRFRDLSADLKLLVICTWIIIIFFAIGLFVGILETVIGS